MKRTLTLEQSKHLIEDLKINPNFASISSDQYDWDTNDYYPIFDTQDLLDIIPKVLIIDNNIYRLEITYISDIVCVSYESYNGSKEYFNRSELIDALYEMIDWLYEHKYVN